MDITFKPVFPATANIPLVVNKILDTNLSQKLNSVLQTKKFIVVRIVIFVK